MTSLIPLKSGSFEDGINMSRGDIYLVPENINLPHSMIFYNKDLFVKAGLDPDNPPETYAELRQYAHRITEAGKGEFYGFIEGGQQVNRWKTIALDFSSIGGSGFFC